MINNVSVHVKKRGDFKPRTRFNTMVFKRHISILDVENKKSLPLVKLTDKSDKNSPFED